MTAEVAILNQSGVAMAADSAVTIEINGDRKIYQTANKVFSLSKHHPVGIMVHGNSTFMGVQWEIAIKLYRRQLGRTGFDTIEQYAEDFFRFLCSHSEIAKENRQHDYLRQLLGGTYAPIRDETIGTVEQRLQEVKHLSNDEILEVFRTCVEGYHEVINAAAPTEHADGTALAVTEVAKLKKKLRPFIVEARAFFFEKLPTDSALSRKLNAIGEYALLKSIAIGPDSGVVIAGYGEAEVFPAVATYRVGGIVSGILNLHSHSVDRINDEVSAIVIPFAQSEMVYAFMRGIDPQLSQFTTGLVADAIGSIVETIISELPDTDEYRAIFGRLKSAEAKIAGHLDDRLAEYSDQHFIKPIISMVASLPKPELAAMAETLVNLTSFKRRVSTDAETVGGPIDVALISKGDGLVWINRKHHFDKDLNYHFFMNYSDKREGEA